MAHQIGGRQGNQTFDEVAASGPACRPLDFPAPVVLRGVRVNACLVVHLESGTRQVCSGVIHREDLSGSQESVEIATSNHKAGQPGLNAGAAAISKEVLAYWPHRQLQDAIYGSVWCCLVLRRHYGTAADDAARAAGVAPGSPNAPIVWEITGEMAAIKMVEWERVFKMRGRLLEDPVKEVAAMQLLGVHPNVLGSSEVLQDDHHLYSVMPYCRGGDLFSVVVEHAEANNGEIGMPEPVARFWFRQILNVSIVWGIIISSSIFASERAMPPTVRAHFTNYRFSFRTTTTTFYKITGTSTFTGARCLPPGPFLGKCTSRRLQLLNH